MRTNPSSCNRPSPTYRRYYQPPSVPASAPGMTGRAGAPLWRVLVPFLSVVGGSLGLAFAYATGTHWGVYVAMAGALR